MCDKNIKVIIPPPLDIQIEIIKRLPIESLLKFRLVSTPWKSIIHSSTFISDYYKLNSSSTHHLLLASHSREYVDIIDDGGFPEHHKSRIYFPCAPSDRSLIIGCSKGLLAIYVVYTSSYNDVAVVIWNPSIRKYVYKPVPDILKSPYKTAFGFGIVSNNNHATDDDPVIVKISYIGVKRFDSCASIPSQVQVLKLSTGTWRTLSSNSNCLPRKSLLFRHLDTNNIMVAIDRFIYWHVFDRAPNDHISSMILSFNMISEDFTEIHLPDSLAHRLSRYFGLSKLRGSLVVLEPNFVENKLEYTLWMMEEHGLQKSFKTLYAIKAPDASIENVLGFRKNGQPIVEIRKGLKEQTSLFVYDPDSQQLNDSGIPADGYPRLASSYTSTLLLLNH